MADKSAAKQRALIGNVNVELFGSLFSFPVDVVPERHAYKSLEAVTTICPACDTPTRLHQRSLCLANPEHGPYRDTEVAKALDIEGQLARITTEQREALTAPDIEERQLKVRYVPAAGLDAVTMPGEALYRLRPKRPSAAYSLLRTLIVTRTDVAMVGELVVKGGQKLYRLIVWRGQVMAQERIRPDALYDVDEIADVEYGKAEWDMAVSLMEERLTEFLADEFRSRPEQRARDLIAEKAPDAVAVTDPDQPTSQGSDLTALLELSKQQAEAKKRSRKKAPAKKAAPRKKAAPPAVQQVS